MIYSSEHIIITHLKPEDALHLNKLFVSNNEHLKRFLPKTLAANRTLSSTKSYIDDKIKSMQSDVEYVYTIKDHYTSNIAGLVILKNIDWNKKQGEFAYCISKKFESKGWMSEAVEASTRFAIKNLGLNKLQIIAHKDNVGSIKVALNSGYRWKETLKNEFTPLNEVSLDMELYELNYEG